MFNKLNLVDTISNCGEFSILGKAITSSGLSCTFEGTGTHTVLALTDEAFNKLPSETIIDLMMPENKTVLANLLKHHAIDAVLLLTNVSRVG